MIFNGGTEIGANPQLVQGEGVANKNEAVKTISRHGTIALTTWRLS